MSGDIRSPTMISRRSAAEKHENLTFSKPYPGASFVAPGYLWTGTDGQYLIFVASSSCFSLGLSSDGFYGGGENWYSTAISVRTHWYSLEQMTIIHSTLLTSLIQRNKPELDTADIKQTNFQLSPLQTFNNYNNIINHSPPPFSPWWWCCLLVLMWPSWFLTDWQSLLVCSHLHSQSGGSGH